VKKKKICKIMNTNIDKEYYDNNFLIERSISDVSPINDDDQGVQGFVYKCIWKNQPAVMKTSNYIDFILELEEDAWNHLKKLNCIHFCEVLEKLPLNIGEKRYCLFFKEIVNNNQNDSLANLIFEGSHHPNAILNCIRQSLCAMIMFETLGITHYDLHADNVMITNTPYDFHVYKFEDCIIPIKTYGLAPVIIDFGMAYIPNTRYHATCVFSKDGYTTFMPDPIVDSRLLLKTAGKDLKELLKYSKSQKQRKVSTFKYKDAYKTIEKFTKIIDIFFTTLKLRENGWYKQDNIFPNINNFLVRSLPKMLRNSNQGIFKTENFNWVVELLQNEIKIPIVERKDEEMSFEKTTCLFAIEWKKYVEPIIRNTHEELLFFKDLVLIPHDFSENEKQYITIKHRYPNIKNIKRLRDIIRHMGNALNNTIYDNIMEINKIKQDLYSKLPHKTTKDILRALPTCTNKYKEGMSLLVMDPLSSIHQKVILTKDLATMLNDNEQETLQKYIVQ